MASKFNQVESSTIPHFHYVFKGKSLNSEEVVYNIEVLTKDSYDEAIKLLFKYHTPEETFQKSIKLVEKDFIFEFLKSQLENIFNENVTLACYVIGSHKMVGINVLKITSKCSEAKELEMKKQLTNIDPDLKTLMDSIDFVNSHFNVFSHYDVDQYLDGVALCVNSDHRGRGISTELLKARKPLMKMIDLTVTATNFSTIGSQKAAEKAGFVEKMSISYEEIVSNFPRLDFSHANTSHCKKYAYKIA